MSLAKYIREIAHDTDRATGLSEEDAHDLFAVLLDGGATDLELGAVLAALRVKSESLSEMLGFHRAMSERVHAMAAPQGRLKPLVIGAYNGARDGPNLLPLLALMLRRLGIPVLLHGTLEGSGRVACAYILRELGVMPCISTAHAQNALAGEKFAFVPTATLSPGMANLLALRNRLGVRNAAHNMVKVLDPFQGESVKVVGAAHPLNLGRLEAFLNASGIEAVLLRSTEGEPFANPLQRPRMVHFRDGAASTLFEEEAPPSRGAIGLPERDAAATAHWIRLALEGQVPVPHPIVNQLACCLFACGYTEDMNQAKAIAAVEAGGLATAAARGRQNAAID